MEEGNPWDQYANFYVKKMEKKGYYWPRDKVFQAVLACSQDHLAGKSVLDLACGFGNFSLILEKNGAVVTGVDRSRNMIEIARKKSSNSSVSYLVADSDKIPVRSNSFDTVVCNMALQDIEDVQSTLDELVRVTKSGAKVVFSIRHPFTDDWTRDYTKEQRIDNLISDNGDLDAEGIYSYPPRYHRSLCFYLNCIIGYNIVIEHCEEIVDAKGRPFAVVIAGNAK